VQLEEGVHLLRDGEDLLEAGAHLQRVGVAAPAVEDVVVIPRVDLCTSLQSV
jgi:hypothetical protein